MIGFGEHDAAGYKLSIANIPIEGYAPDTAIKIEPNADHRSHRVGVTGDVVSSKSNDRSAIATITLMKTSKAHRALLALLALDQATPGGAGVGPFELRDLIDGITESSPLCWIKRRPDMTVGGEDPDFEWKFILASWTSDVPTT